MNVNRPWLGWIAVGLIIGMVLRGDWVAVFSSALTFAIMLGAVWFTSGRESSESSQPSASRSSAESRTVPGESR